ncbi:MAG: ATP-dependent DNA/RNA helicase [Sarea resinae]|nr:MAG: ATP-dependent DNA/RNA helicase [Sarea resinae]
MKRKLDQNDVPKEVTEAKDSSEEVSFDRLGLDPRILQGLVKEKFSKPTPVQAKAIPLALEGKDILARAKTGSGKTAAYVLPILQSILKRKTAPSPVRCTSALILVPTRELADQVSKVFAALGAFCTKDIRAVNLTQKVSDAVQRSILADLPDVVVATPARVALNLSTSALSLEQLAHLVIDEADLVLSYGYDEDLQAISRSLPKSTQSFLMSATLTTEIDTLKGLFCKNPVILRLEEGEEEGEGVSQFMVKCAEDEKFLLAYVIFKLKLVKGKCIIFVGDIDRCYRLKLFLEQFGIRSCVLNSELPVNSRIHVVEEFNKNVYDIIIATDEHEVLGEEDDEDVPTVSEAAEDKGKDIEAVDTPKKQASEEPSRKKRKQAKPGKNNKEYGVSRGIDFRNVACVLNFDLPTSSRSYTHRIGRTARAGKTGMALSFVVPAHLHHKHPPTSIPSTATDEAVLAKIEKHQRKRGKAVQPYHFDKKQLEPFRYRMTDALRAVTRVAVREARSRELRNELLASDKLRRHFEENPDQLRELRHDADLLRPARVQAHLRHVPEYLLPTGGAANASSSFGGGPDKAAPFVGLRKDTGNRIRRARMANRAKGKRGGGRKADPLKTFSAKGGKR